MTTKSQVFKILRDFLASPDDPALQRKALRYLAHNALGEFRALKKIIDDDDMPDRLLCPRCWGNTRDEIGSEKPCRRCKVGSVASGTIPK